jgi:phasin family protein
MTTTDLTKFFDITGFTVNIEKALEANKRSLEAIKKANTVIAEGASTVAARQLELTQSAMEESIEAARGLATTKGVDGFAAKNADVIRTTFEKGVHNALELMAIANKAQTEAAEIISKQLVENVNLLAEEAKKAAAKGAAVAKK